MPRPSPRLSLSLAVFALLLVMGTLWYGVVEHFGLLDAIYQVVTTISTVGYNEVQPLDTSGRIFTIVYILIGIGVMFYVATLVVEELIVGGIADTLSGRRLNRRARSMRDHVVICGMGRVGREVSAVMRERGNQVVAIDNDESRADAGRKLGCVVIVGDATDEEVLREAQVEHARAVVAAASSDAVNTFIVLTARDLNPDAHIVVRAGSESAHHRMVTAGANYVVSPYQIAGKRMALAVAQPMMIDFIDSLVDRRGGHPEILAEVLVGEGATGLSGRMIADVFDHHATRVLAVIRENGHLLAAPDGTVVLEPGDRLMLYGMQPEIERLAHEGLSTARAR